MMPRSCFCGRRALPGKTRCETHLSGTGRPSACLECGRRTDGELYCTDHAYLTGEAGRLERQPYRQHYESAEYRTNRQLAWERCGGRCEKCGRPITQQTAECDHIVPVADGGSDELGNLEYLCEAACHPAKTKEDRRRRAMGRR